jgi:hypothetical protein
MKYALMIYTAPPTAPPDAEEGAAEMLAYQSFTQEITAAGAMLGGEALDEVATATTVRVRDGRVITSDGPFAETKEVLGGFYLVECADIDEAISWAAKIPGARHGSIEVRPLWAIPEEFQS